VDFNLSQFGLFIDNDTLYMTVHINDFIKYIGRKPISGDVLELPHLRDDFALNEFDFALPRYYVIEDVGRASEGFSVTWFPHLYRLKLKKVTDSQQFAQIFDQQVKDANGDPVADTTLRDLLSTHNQELRISDAVVQQAEIDVPKSGFETRQYYTIAASDTLGTTVLNTTDNKSLLASNAGNVTAGAGAVGVPQRSGYTGYLLGDGFPVNGYDFGFGIQFPANPAADDFFLRVDMLPNRLYRFEGRQNAWIAVEDAVRMDMTNTNSRNTLKTGFINNHNWTYNEPVISDFARLAKDAVRIRTTIDPAITGVYVVLKLETTLIEYVVADHPGFITQYNFISPTGISSAKIQINLPVVDEVQQKIPYAGQWTVTFYNHRESQRQSISKALKPRADL
jgi:hypothetical protein